MTRRGHAPHVAGPDAAPAADAGLGQQAASGAIWVTGQKWAAKITGIVTVAILTRLVSPSEFGVLAAATAIVPLVALLADLGFSTYVVQARSTNPRMLSTGFWFSVAAASVLGGGIALLAPLIGDVLHLPEVVPVLRVIVVSVVAAVLGSIPTALLRRRMAFRLLAGQAIGGALVGQLVAVALAVAGAGVWALVGQLVSCQVVMTVLAWRAARWRPSMQFSGRYFAEMTRFGTKVVGVDAVALVRDWAETAIIVTTLGSAGLGYLSIAQRLVQVAQDLGASAVLSVSMVVFAKMRHTAERLVGGYLRALRITYTVATTLPIFVAVSAPVLVTFVFGQEWEPSVTVTSFLAVAAVLTMGAALDNGLFYGAGRPGAWLVYAVVIDALTVGATAIGVHAGLVGVAIGFLVVALLATLVRWVFVGRLLHVGLTTVARPLVTCGAIALVAGAAGLGVLALTHAWPAVVCLAMVGLTVLIVQVALMRLFTPNTYRDIVNLLRVRDRWDRIVHRYRAEPTTVA